MSAAETECKWEMSSELRQFNYLHSELDALYHEIALKMNLSDSAMILLYTICQTGEPCPLKAAYRLSCISKQTFSSSLRKLEAEGIVAAQIHGRQKLLFLTEEGRRLAERTVLRLIAVEDSIFREWSPEERRLHLELSQRYISDLRRKMGEITEPGAPRNAPAQPDESEKTPTA